MQTFDVFSKYAGMKLNTSKCKIAGIGAKRGAIVALCGMESVDMLCETINILGIHYSYDKKTQETRNYLGIIKDIEKLLKLWKMRSLTLIGRIAVFKSLILSKIVYLTFLTDVPESVNEILRKLQYDFLWEGKRAKIKQSTLIGSYENGGLKSVDINSKIEALQLSWLKRLYDQNEHQWKQIPKYFIKKYYFSEDIFYPNLNVDIISDMPAFYQNIIIKWSKIARSEPVTASTIYTQKIWFNFYLKIEDKSYLSKIFDKAGIKFVKDVFAENGRLLKWNEFHQKYNLSSTHFFKWRQIVESIPKHWKHLIIQDQGKSRNNGILHQHLLDLTRQLCMDRMTSSQIYTILIRTVFVKPASEQTIQIKLNMDNIDWNNVYEIGGKTTIDTYGRMFNFKLNHNMLLLNKALFIRGLTDSKICPFCNIEEETIIHLFANCPITVNLWGDLQVYYENILYLPNLTPQSAFLGFWKLNENSKIINHILLIFKITIYRSREKQKCKLELILNTINKIRHIEKQITFPDARKKENDMIKWAILENF